jgi:hypothetical protein
MDEALVQFIPRLHQRWDLQRDIGKDLEAAELLDGGEGQTASSEC